MKSKVKLLYKNILNKLTMQNESCYIILLICLKILMDLYYVFVVADFYAYHYYLIYGNALKYFFSWILLLAIFKMMPRKENSICAFFLHTQLIFMVMPMMTLYAFTKGKSTIYLIMITIAIIVECIIIRSSRRSCFPVKIKGIKPFVSAFIIVALPVCLILLINYGGFAGLRAFDFEEIYIIRESANYPVLLSYVSSWISYVIIPFYIVYCLEKKQYAIVLLLVFQSMILYMVMAQKVIYLSLLVILITYFFAKSGHLIKVMYSGMSMLFGFLGVFYLIDKSGEVGALSIYSTALLGDRFLFGPALNKFLYYDVFSQYPKMLFSDGLIGKLLGLTYKYNYGPGQIAFGYVWNGRLGESNSCTGYLGDGYAQMGFVGLFLGVVILAFLIKYIDAYNGVIPFSILAAMIALYVVTLNDTALHTTIITAGLFIFLILIAIYAEVSEDRENGEARP